MLGCPLAWVLRPPGTHPCGRNGMKGNTIRKGDTMRPRSMLLSLVSLIVLLSSISQGATVTGTVKGPDGAPFQGAFVEAQNTKANMTVNVLSESHGRYRIDKVPGAECS